MLNVRLNNIFQKDTTLVLLGLDNRSVTIYVAMDTWSISIHVKSKCVVFFLFVRLFFHDDVV